MADSPDKGQLRRRYDREVGLKFINTFYKHRIGMSLVTLFVFVLMTVCCNYYKITSHEDHNDQRLALENAFNENSYFVIVKEGTDMFNESEEQLKNKVYFVSNLEINDDYLKIISNPVTS